MLVGSLGVVVAYVLSRTSKHTLGAALAIGVLFMLSYVTLTHAADLSSVEITAGWMWMAIPLLLGGLSLPAWCVALIAASNLIGTATIQIAISGPASLWFFQGIAYITVVSLLVSVAAIALRSNE